MSKLGGYHIVDFSQFGNITIPDSGANVTIENVPDDVIKALNDPNKPTVIVGLNATKNSETFTDIIEHPFSVTTSGIRRWMLRSFEVRIYSASANQLTIAGV